MITNTLTTRQVKIALITDVSNPIIEWFNDLWNQLNIIEVDIFHKDSGGILYYIDAEEEKRWIFYRHDGGNRFWCNYKHYWGILSYKFKFNYSDAQELTKILVENALDKSNNIVIPIPDWLEASTDYQIKNFTNNKLN